MPKQVIVLTWAKLDGARPTGRTVRRDGYDRAEYETCPEVRAVVWSRNLAELAGAKAYAAHEGYEARVLDDTPDVLEKAKALHVAEGCRLTS